MADAALTDYMDAAIERQHLKSDRALGRTMKVAQLAVTRWRTGKAYPTDPQMVILAQLAGANEEQALILLNIWRAKDEQARSTYARLLRRFGLGPGAAVAIVLSAGLADPPRSYSLDNYPKPDSFTHYILCAFARLRRWISRRVAAPLYALAP